jgi:hypothetical protein
VVDGPPSAPDLRPLGVGEVLDVALKLFFRHAGTLLVAVGVVIVPVQLLLVPVFTSALPDPQESGTALDPAFDGAQIAVSAAALLVALLLTFVATILATAACYKAVTDAYLGGRPHWRASLAFAGARLGPVVWVSVLSAVLSLLPLVLLLVPVTVWLYVSWSVVVPVLLTEGLRGRRALARSRGLVRGRWWATFATLLVAFIAASIVQVIVSGLLGAVVLADVGEQSLAGVLVNQLLTAISALLITPFLAAVVVVLYIDLRVRKEGFDLALLAERVGVPPAREPAGGNGAWRAERAEDEPLPPGSDAPEGGPAAPPR